MLAAIVTPSHRIVPISRSKEPNSPRVKFHMGKWFLKGKTFFIRANYQNVGPSFKD